MARSGQLEPVFPASRVWLLLSALSVDLDELLVSVSLLHQIVQYALVQFQLS